MKALSHIWLAACCALPLSGRTGQEGPTTLLEGVARRLPDREVVYLETHRLSALSHRVDYRLPDGRLIAENTLDYRCSQSAPAFEQRDARTGDRIGGRWQEGRYVLSSGGLAREIDATPTLVASSGFDRFVRLHWDTLARGEHVNADFALPSSLETLQLRIKRFAARGEDTAVAHWFRIEAASPMLRLFAAPIVVGYDSARNLAVYRGVSNLADHDGSALTVEIRYAPPGENESPIALQRESANNTCHAAPP